MGVMSSIFATTAAAYEKNGVKITHWRQSHTEDGVSAYRLNWNGMSVAFTGDGRPNSLTIKYAQGS